MPKKTTYVLCMNDEAADIFSTPLAEDQVLDNEEITTLIFSLFTQKSVGSDIVFSESIRTLIESSSFDFMVYRIVDDNRSHLLDIDTWTMELEITEQAYDKLFLNLCQKLRAHFNSYKKQNRKRYKSS